MMATCARGTTTSSYLSKRTIWESCFPVTGPSEEYIVEQGQDGMTLLQTIKAQVEASVEYAQRMLTPSLSERAQDAIEASNNQSRTQRIQDLRANER